MVRIPDELRAEGATARGIATGDRLLDQYEVGRLLGKGGMGAVFEGLDTQLDRKVAIKVLPAFLASSTRAIDGLRAEAKRTIALAHSSLARIHHFAVHDGQPFVIMEFVEGRTLAALLEERGTLPLDETLGILRPLAAALDHAHAEGVVHRDVKPSNIMLRASDGRPVLIDFGIAGEARDQTTLAGLTDRGGTSGTLVYMSPEQVRGDAPRRSMDVYSLAAVAYEMLAGNPPFFRGDPMNVQYQILNEPPRPIPGIPEPVSAGLLQGLSKLVSDRPASATALVDRLEGRPGAAPVRGPGNPAASGSDLPESCCPTDPPEVAVAQAGTPTSRHRFLGFLGVLDGMSSALVGGLIWNVGVWHFLREHLADLDKTAPGLYFFLHFLPPAACGIPIFGLSMLLGCEFLERRIPGITRPLMNGAALGVVFGSLLVSRVMKHVGETAEIAQVAVVLVGLLGAPVIVATTRLYLASSLHERMQEAREHGLSGS